MKPPVQLVEKLRSAVRVVVLTGAGVSAESGVPTFRDAQAGLWAQYSPEDLATPQAFRRNPRLVWEWYASRRESVAGVSPNPAHHALVELETLVPEFHLITQNVDGLHHRAGSRNVIELHGNITRTKCFDENSVVASWAENGEIPPKCPRCGGLLRPDVVWFDEPLPEAELTLAARVSAACDVFLAVGTSALVYPAAGLPVAAVRSGAIVAEINPHPTPFTRLAHFAVAGNAGVVLPEVISALRAARGG